MTVKELIKELEKLPQNAKLVEWDEFGNGEYSRYPSDYEIFERNFSVKKLYPNRVHTDKYVEEIDVTKRKYNKWYQSAFKDYWDIAEEVVVME